MKKEYWDMSIKELEYAEYRLSLLCKILEYLRIIDDYKEEEKEKRPIFKWDDLPNATYNQWGYVLG